MSTFSRISVTGFRRLRNVSISLEPLNVMIGANGCGKSTLIDVFPLLSAVSSGSLSTYINEMGGLRSSLTNLSEVDSSYTNTATFEIEAIGLDRQPLSYHIELAAQATGFSIKRETLINEATRVSFIESQHGNTRYLNSEYKLVEPEWPTMSWDDTALAEAPKVHKNVELFRNQLKNQKHYHTLDVSSSAPVRLPQQLRAATSPGANGEYLAASLYLMRESSPDKFERLQNTMRAGFPNFERLGFPPVAAGTLAVTWKEKTSNEPFYMHQLSEGTLRFLWLVTLLYTAEQDTITLIDEPEVSLHPELLSIIAELLREVSNTSQLIVATHSDRLVRFLKPEEVLAMDVLEDGSVSIARADTFDLNQWLDEFSLDEIWRMGRMGARP